MSSTKCRPFCQYRPQHAECGKDILSMWSQHPLNPSYYCPVSKLDTDTNISILGNAFGIDVIIIFVIAYSDASYGLHTLYGGVAIMKNGLTTFLCDF